MVSNFPFLVIGLIGLVLCYYGDYFKFRYCGSLLYVQCLEWIKSFIVQSVIIFDILIIACKESFGVGRVFTSVWLLLQSDPHTIIWSQMMLVLCGIACQWVWSCNKSHLLYRMSTAIKMPYFTLIDIFFLSYDNYRWQLRSHRSLQSLSLKGLMSGREQFPSYLCFWRVLSAYCIGGKHYILFLFMIIITFSQALFCTIENLGFLLCS